MGSKKKSGFTLIELLASIAVFIILGTIIAVILYSSLKASDKTAALTVVRQSGNYTISQMAKTIRNAKNFIGGIPEGGSSAIFCDANSTKRYKSIVVTSAEGLATSFSCDTSTISQNGSSLLDTGVNGVSLVSDSCFFTCTQTNSSDVPTIGINFSLTSYTHPGVNQFFEKKTTPVEFRTSVIIRNFPR